MLQYKRHVGKRVAFITATVKIDRLGKKFGLKRLEDFVLGLHSGKRNIPQ